VSADVREYLKLRISDEESYWPKFPLDFRDHFTKMYDFMHELAWACLITLANNKLKNNNPLLTTQQLSAIKDFAYKKSNISIIHYYPIASSSNKIACAEHRDTGLITLLVSSNVPGLQIFDNFTKSYNEIEKILPEYSVVVMVGQKIPNYSSSTEFNGTLHRVMTESGVERSSMAFLLDVAK